MTFKNALQGVKKLFTAEILNLIAIACALVAAVIGLLAVSATVAGSEGGAVASGVGTIVFLAASVVLPIIAFIMHLVGLRQAGKDEDYFQTAFIYAIFALVIRVISGVFTLLNVGNGIADNIAITFSRICEIIVFVLVVYGITNLADRLHKSGILGTASKLITLYIITYGIAIIADLIVIFFPGETSLTIGGIMGIISAICSLVAYIIYLVYLGKAKAMLRDN